MDQKKYAQTEHYTIYKASCLDVMDSLEENSVDAIITDPPYEIGFMNKEWDSTGIAFDINTWKKALRVLKPGGYLLAFNHSRTFHRMMIAIEDAGFELRDTIMWLYGTGFPKSHSLSLMLDKKLGYQKQRGIGGFNVSGYGEKDNRKAKLHIKSSSDNSDMKTYSDPKSEEAKKWSGWGTALKPAFEPIVMARKPLSENTIIANVIKHNVGGINIDECRIPTDQKIVYSKSKAEGITKFTTGTTKQNKNGRFPSNVIHDNSMEVLKEFPNTKSGSSNGFIGKDTNEIFGKYKNNVIDPNNVYGDEGSASRFFYGGKASVKDKEEGLEAFEPKFTASAEFRPNHMEKALEGENGNPYGRWNKKKNIHPTVKPTDLMQYLARLVAPKNSTILDIFMGSGSTGKAAMLENVERNANYKFIGVDLDCDENGNSYGYCDISIARLEWAINYKALEKEKRETTTYYEDGIIKKAKQESLF